MILFKTIHKDYVSTWQDYQKTSSYRVGARWSSAEVPVMYASSNAQNSMLEIANYMPKPSLVNKPVSSHDHFVVRERPPRTRFVCLTMTVAKDLQIVT